MFVGSLGGGKGQGELALDVTRRKKKKNAEALGHTSAGFCQKGKEIDGYNMQERRVWLWKATTSRKESVNTLSIN